MAEDLARAGIVVTGGPGAGKTTLIAAALRAERG
jgi:predicted ATPase